MPRIEAVYIGNLVAAATLFMPFIDHKTDKSN